MRAERHPGVWHYYSEGMESGGVGAGVWVETVTEGGRRFMIAWRKQEVNAARHRQEKRKAARLKQDRTFVIVNGRV